MDNGQELCIRWSDFQTSFQQSLSELRAADALTDVSICCQQQQQRQQQPPLRAHRLVLCAGSAWLQQQLCQLPQHQPAALLLPSIERRVMADLLQFLYTGQVNVHQDRLEAFLSAADLLQVQGLATGRDRPEEHTSQHSKVFLEVPEHSMLFSDAAKHGKLESESGRGGENSPPPVVIAETQHIYVLNKPNHLRPHPPPESRPGSEPQMEPELQVEPESQVELEPQREPARSRLVELVMEPVKMEELGDVGGYAESDDTEATPPPSRLKQRHRPHGGLGPRPLSQPHFLRRSRSFVWEYFERITPTCARCRVCQKELNQGTSGNTSNLRSHLNTHHLQMRTDAAAVHTAAATAEQVLGSIQQQ